MRKLIDFLRFRVFEPLFIVLHNRCPDAIVNGPLETKERYASHRGNHKYLEHVDLVIDLKAQSKIDRRSNIPLFLSMFS